MKPNLLMLLPTVFVVSCGSSPKMSEPGSQAPFRSPAQTMDGQATPSSCPLADSLEMADESSKHEYKKLRLQYLFKEVETLSKIGAEALRNSSVLASFSGQGMIQEVLRSMRDQTEKDFNIQFECLLSQKLIDEKTFARLKAKFYAPGSDFERAYTELMQQGPRQEDLYVFEKHPPLYRESITNNNSFKILLSVEESQTELIETIRSAERFIHFSDGLYSASENPLVMHELIAKKMGLNSDELKRLLDEKKWVLGRDDFSLQRWFLKYKRNIEVGLENRDLIDDEVERQFVNSTMNFELRLLRDLNISQLDLPANYITLRRYGAQLSYIPNMFWSSFNYSLKFMVTDKNAILGEGITYRVDGSLVNAINQFYAKQFNYWNSVNENLGHIPYFRQWNNVYRKRPIHGIDLDRKLAGDWFYISKKNNLIQGKSGGSFVVTSPLRDVNFKVKPVAEMTFSKAVYDASDYIFLGTKHLAEISTFNLLKKKALFWRLSDVKIQNGESLKKSTCNSEKLFGRQRKDLSQGGKAIVVTVNKGHETELLETLLESGIDVCEAEESFEFKVWAVDRKMAYLGIVNPKEKSHRTDMELGVVVTDEILIDDIYKRLLLAEMKKSDGLESPEFHRSPASYSRPIRWFGNLMRRW